MNKNCKIHLWLESDLKYTIERQAKEEGLSICEFCRQRLKENSRLAKIEFLVEKIAKAKNINTSAY